MNFQGRLTDATGNIKPNGSYNMRLKLYTVSSGGAAVWSEDRLVGNTQGVTVANGTFAIQLGDITTLSSSLFASGPLYLEVELPTPGTATTSSPTWTEGPMTPRNQMATSAYAYNAETLDGLDSAAFGQLGADNSWTGSNTLFGTVTTIYSSSLYADVEDSLYMSAGTDFSLRAGNTLLLDSSLSDTSGALRVSGLGIENTVFRVNNGLAGVSLFSVDKSTSSVTIGSSDTTGTVFVLDTKTDVGDPTGMAGAMYYNSNAGKFRCYQAGAWTDCIGTGSGASLSANNTWTGTNDFTGTLSVSNGAGDIFQADTAGNGEVKIGSYNPDGVVVMLSLDEKNTSGDPIGTTGAMYYNSNSGKFRCYQASAWVDCITAVSGVSLSANNTWTGTNAFQNSSDSTSAFSILNSSGKNLFQIGTSDQKVTLGTAGDFDTLSKLSDPTTMPTGIVYGSAFSADGQYMSVAHEVSPFISIYKRSGDTFTKLANPATLPASHAEDTAFSPDGQYMSVAHYTSPFITIYKRSGDTFTKLPDPAILPPDSAKDTAFSPDGQYMTVGHGSSPFITIYKRSGDTFTKLANPATLPTGIAQGVAFSPDGQYMSVSHSVSPYITIYKRSGDTFTKLANPATLPPGQGNDTAFSPDGQYMTVSHFTTPFITIYKRSGDTFTKLADPATLPGNTAGYGTAFSPDGQYMSVASYGSPYITIYKRSGDTFTKLANPATLPAGSGYSTSFSPDGQYMNVGIGTSGFMAIYKGSGLKVSADLQGSINISNNFTANNASVTNNFIANNASVTNTLTASTFLASGSANVLGDMLAGNGLFSVNTVTSTVSIGLSDTTGVMFVLDTKTDAGDPTGMAGAMYYNSSTGKFRCYQAGAWVDCISAASGASLTANNTFTGSNTFRNSADSATAFQIQDSASTPMFKVDTLNDIVQIGANNSDGVGVVLILDNKNTAGDPNGYPGAMYYNSHYSKFRCYHANSWRNCAGSSPVSVATATQAVSAGVDTYINGSSIPIVGGLEAGISGFQDGSLITWRITMSKTAAGTAASTFTLRTGTNGTTADTSRCSFSTGAATGVADAAVVTIKAYATSGGSSAALNCSMSFTHNLPATGFSTSPAVSAFTTSGFFDSTPTNTVMGLSFNAGTSSVITIRDVEVTATNL